MAIEVGSAYVTLLPSARGFSAALNRQIASPLAGAGKAGGKKWGGGFASSAMPSLKLMSVAAAGIGLAGLVKSSVQVEAEFSKTMNTMAAVADVPKAGIAELSKLALKMGADTSFSANEAATAMLELAKGGLSPATIQAGALQGTLTLAAAGGTDLATAATTAVTAMTQFKLAGKDMNKVAAALAGGANASTASIESLAQGLQQGGAAAAAAGFSLQETVATLSAMDKAGAKGADGGTSLKTALDRLQPTTKLAELTMRDLHLNFVKADGSFRSVTEIAGQLHHAMAKMPDAQRKWTVSTIFGSDAQRFANALIDQGATGMRKMIAATNDMDAANRAAAAATSGTAGALERMSGSIETAKLGFARILAPAVVAGANTVSRATGGIATAMDKLGPKIGEAAKKITPAVVAQVKDLGAKVAAAINLKDLVAKFEAGGGDGAKGVLNGLLNVLKTADYHALGLAVGTGIAKAINAAGGAAAQLTSAFATLMGKVQWGEVGFAVGKQALTIALGLATGLLNVDIGSAFQFVVDHWAAVLTGLIGIAFAPAKLFKVIEKIPLVGTLLSKILGGIKKVARPVFTAVGKFFGGLAKEFGKGVGKVFTAAFPKVGEALGKALDLPKKIGGLATGAVKAAGDLVGKIGGGVKKAAGKIGEAFGFVFVGVPVAIAKGMAKAAVEAGKGVARLVVAIVGFLNRMSGGRLAEMFGKMIEGVKALWSRVSGAVLGAWDRIRAFVGAGVSFVKGLVSRGFAAVKTAVSTVWNAVGSTVSRAWGRIKSAVGAGLDTIKRVVSGGLGKVRKFFGDAWTKVKDALGGALDGIKTRVGEGIGGVITFFKDLPGKIIDALGDMKTLLVDAGKNMIEGLIAGIKDMAGQAASAAKDVVGGAAKAAWDKIKPGSPSRLFRPMGQNAGQGFTAGLLDQQKPAAKAARSVVTAAAKAADKARREALRRAEKAHREALRRAAQAAAEYARRSKAYQRVGDYVAGGFRKGIQGSTKEARNAVSRIGVVARNAVGKARGTKMFADENRALVALVKKRAGIVDQLAAAQKRLNYLRSASAGLAGDVRGSILQGADLTQMGTDPATIVAKMKTAIAAAKQFGENIAKLRDRGLNGSALQQIIDAGVEGGGAIAANLANATKADFAQINQLQKELDKTATNTGKTAADALYSAGIKAAKGLVDGLGSQKGAIEKRMLDIAKGMKAAIKKALGIKSPSRVFTGFGQDIAQGLANGITAGSGQVTTATTRLAGAATFHPSTLAGIRLPAGGVGGGDGAAAPVVHVYIDSKEIESAVVRVSDRRDTALSNGLTYRGM